MDIGVPQHWMDCHNHLHFQVVAGELLETLAALEVERCVVNATCEAEWRRVAALAAASDGRVTPAYGIHPWRVTSARAGWEERLRARLADDPTATVGECGLDGVVVGDLALQRQIFISQLRIACEMQRVVSIHCVRLWGTLLEALSEATPPRFLMHGYRGSAEVGARLVKMGAWFSCNPKTLRNGEGKVAEVLRRLPLDRIVLESDAGAEGSRDWPKIPALAEVLAHAIGENLDKVAEQVQANACALFGHRVTNDSALTTP